MIDIHMIDFDLNSNDWLITFEIIKCLKVFFDAINACAGVYYVTTHMVLIHFLILQKKINNK